MKNLTKQWLKQTILLQWIILVFLAFGWLMALIGSFVQPFLYGRPSVGDVAFSLIIGFGALLWTGYIILNLYKNLQSTKAYLVTKKSIHWQEAMQYQFLFWKNLVLMFSAGIILMLLFIIFIFFLFASGS